MAHAATIAVAAVILVRLGGSGPDADPLQVAQPPAEVVCMRAELEPAARLPDRSEAFCRAAAPKTAAGEPEGGFTFFTDSRGC